MSDQNTKEFNRRLSQWVASQGFWFQMRYSMSSSTLRSRLFSHLLSMGLKLIILLVLGALLFWGYLFKRVASEAYAEQITEVLETRLAAEELALRGMSYAEDQLVISRIAADGGPNTFFESLLAYNVSCDMGLIQSYSGGWESGTVRIGKLDVNLRAGSDDEGAAAAVGQILFGEGTSQITSFDVVQANLDWGFSKATHGSIAGSKLQIQRTESGWRLNFKGGTFSQNWLNKLEIIELSAFCTPDGIVFEKARFAKGVGTAEFDGLRLKSGVRPELDGMLKVRGANLEDMLPELTMDYLEGVISGDFKVFGSTNSTRGVGYDGEIRLRNGEVISLKDKLPLLSALSVVDYSRSYHRIDFKQGSLNLLAQAGTLEFSDINLMAATLDGDDESKLILEGGFKMRPPNKDEILQAVEDGLIDKRELPADFDKTDVFDFSLVPEDSDFSRTSSGAGDGGAAPLFDRLNSARETRERGIQLARRIFSMMQYSGECVAVVPGNAFERAGQLRELYPVDEETGRVRVRVPLKGELDQLTKGLSEELYKKGRRP